MKDDKIKLNWIARGLYMWVGVGETAQCSVQEARSTTMKEAEKDFHTEQNIIRIEMWKYS